MTLPYQIRSLQGPDRGGMQWVPVVSPADNDVFIFGPAEIPATRSLVHAWRSADPGSESPAFSIVDSGNSPIFLTDAQSQTSIQELNIVQKDEWVHVVAHITNVWDSIHYARFNVDSESWDQNALGTLVYSTEDRSTFHFARGNLVVRSDLDLVIHGMTDTVQVMGTALSRTAMYWSVDCGETWSGPTTFADDKADVMYASPMLVWVNSMSDQVQATCILKPTSTASSMLVTVGWTTGNAWRTERQSGLLFGVSADQSLSSLIARHNSVGSWQVTQLGMAQTPIDGVEAIYWPAFDDDTNPSLTRIRVNSNQPIVNSGKRGMHMIVDSDDMTLVCFMINSAGISDRKLYYSDDGGVNSWTTQTEGFDIDNEETYQPHGMHYSDGTDRRYSILMWGGDTLNGRGLYDEVNLGGGGTFIDMHGDVHGNAAMEAAFNAFQGLHGNVDSVALVEAQMNAFQGFFGVMDSVMLAEGVLNIDKPLSGNMDSVMLAEGTIAKMIGVAGNSDSVVLVEAQINAFQGFFGVSDGVALLEGAVALDIGLRGNIDPVALLEGAMGAQTGLHGNVDSVADVVGALNAFTGLFGVIDTVGLFEGALNAFTGLHGNIDSVSNVEAALNTLQGFFGNIDNVALLEGALGRATLGLGGNIDSVMLAEGDLEILGGATFVDMHGDVVSISEVQGAIGVLQALAGNSDAVALLEGVLNIDKPLAGVIDSVASVEGALDAFTGLFGVIDAVAEISASADAQTGMAGVIDTVGLLEAAMNTFTGFHGNIDSVMLAEADLEILSGTTFIDIHGTVTCIALVEGSIDGQPGFFGVIDATALLEGAMGAQTGLHGNIDSEAQVEGALNAASGLAGTIIGQGDAQAFMGKFAGLHGNIDSVSSLAGFLSSLIGFHGEVVSKVTIDAALANQVGLTGTVDGLSELAGAMDGITGLIVPVEIDFTISDRLVYAMTLGEHGTFSMRIGDVLLPWTMEISDR